MTSGPAQSSASSIPDQTSKSFNAEKFSDSKTGMQLATWIRKEYTRAKTTRQKKQLQWYTNLAFFYGKQWVTRSNSSLSDGFREKLISPRKPYYMDKKTINRTRAIVRSDFSKLVGNIPTVVGIPATAEDQDVQAAYAAEQVWESVSASSKLNQTYRRAALWTMLTGNGFVKTWWDDDKIDKASGQNGTICYHNISPFNLYVPDLREVDIEDEPFIILADVKPVQWCQLAFADELGDYELKPSVSSNGSQVEDGHMNLPSPSSTVDACVIYEAWIKPGATKLLPQGGLVIMVDERIVRFYDSGIPYSHGEFPVTKFEHIPSGTFYADTPLVDTNELNREYNQLRTDLSLAVKRMGRPQIVAQKGSVQPQKMTNEPGLVIEYTPGSPPPQPLPMMQISPEVSNLMAQSLQDIEDLTGRNAVIGGDLQGIRSAAQVQYLQELTNSFYAPQFASIEEGYEKIASQTIQLFVQYVDIKRKVRLVGADGAFDTLMLQGADIRDGTDVRVENGSAVPMSQAAKQAQIMDLWNSGIIRDPDQAFQLMELGGPLKALNIFNAAEKKAQRENIKMKMLKPADVIKYLDEQQQIQQQEYIQQTMMTLQSEIAQLQQPMQAPQSQMPSAPGMPPQAPAPGAPGMPPQPGGAGMPPEASGMPGAPAAPGGPPESSAQMLPAGPQYDPTAPINPTDPNNTLNGQPPVDPNDPTAINTQSPFGPTGPAPIPPIIPVDSFDVHEQHIISHNLFRMGQEYELLDPIVKAQFELHVQVHVQKAQQGQLQSFLSQIPSDGTDPSAPAPPSNMVPVAVGPGENQMQQQFAANSDPQVMPPGSHP